VSGLTTLVNLIRGKRIAVLTGAGISTDSGIPDYGGLHSKTRATRIQYKAFMNDPIARRRYWARSAVGWMRVGTAEPNGAHRALSELERLGCVTGIITQNVDGLHHRAGNQNIVELHGTLSRVRCVDCETVHARASLQARLEERNPFLESLSSVAAPDGDAEVTDDRLQQVVIPTCDRCGGILKPDVVFFGENVPKDRLDRAWKILDDSEVLMTVGTSLAVFSGYRFVLRAVKENQPVIIINDGETRGDAQATLKIPAPIGAILPELARAMQKGTDADPSDVRSPAD
jgi:NAD-dependent deacetylase sirtuin 4